MRGERGTVLVLVLWVLALLTLVGGFYAVEARIRRNLGQQAWDSLQGREAVRSVLLFCQGRLASPDAAVDEALVEGRLAADGTVYTVRLGSREVIFRLEDERGKVDLNMASEAQIRQVLRGVLGDERMELTDTITDSILDWKDTDNLVRLDGAEDEVYEEKRPAYRAANGPFRLINELLLVNGVTHDLFYGPLEWTSAENAAEDGVWIGGLQDLFTVYNRSQAVVREYAPLPLQDVLADELQDGGQVNGTVRLKLQLGGQHYQIFGALQAQGKGFQLVHWSEALMGGSGKHR